MKTEAELEIDLEAKIINFNVDHSARAAASKTIEAIREHKEDLKELYDTNPPEPHKPMCSSCGEDSAAGDWCKNEECSNYVPRENFEGTIGGL